MFERRQFCLGLGLAALQLLAVLMISTPAHLSEKLLSLTNWDGNWFCSILEHGYLNRPPINRLDVCSVNLAFFPAYPVFAKFVAEIFFLPDRLALLAASLIASWLFWTLLLALSRGFSRCRRVGIVLGVFAFPTSFYLVLGYSEGLFLVFVLGLALSYFSDWRPFSTGLFGLFAGATRLVGLPIGLVPFIHSIVLDKLLKERTGGKIEKTIRIALISLVGPGSFFLYCWGKFGEPLISLRAHREGWGVKMNPLALASSRLWRTDLTFAWFSYKPSSFDAIQFAIFMTSAFAWIMLIIFAVWISQIIRQRQSKPLKRALFYLFMAILLYIIPVVSFFDLRFMSMPRYLLPVAILLLLALGELPFPSTKRERMLVTVAGILVLVISVCIQVILIQRFTSKEWVA